MFVIQIGYLIMIGVRTTQNAVFFNSASSFCTFSPTVFMGIPRGIPTNRQFRLPDQQSKWSNSAFTWEALNDLIADVVSLAKSA